MRALALIENETLKLLRRRRPQLVLVILTIFLGVATYGQWRQQQNAIRNGDPSQWRAQVEQRVNDLERRAERRRIFVGFNRIMRFEAVRLRHHLERGIDPNAHTGPLFARAFAALASAVLIPLLVTLMAADVVSSETSTGTIKMLLTRPVARWKVLASKLVAGGIFATLWVAVGACLSWALGGLAFGWQGWTSPVLTGFRTTVDGVDLTGVRIAPLWMDTLAAYGLAWFGALATAAMALMFSVLFKSTAASLGTLATMLASGVLLTQIGGDWELTRWVFMTNLPLAQYYWLS